MNKVALSWWLYHGVRPQNWPLKVGEEISNSVDAGQIAPLEAVLKEQSDSGLHCLPISVCPKQLRSSLHIYATYLKKNIFGTNAIIY